MNLTRIIVALVVLALPLGCSAESDSQTSTEQVGQVEQRLDDDCMTDFDCGGTDPYCGMDGDCQTGCGLWSEVTCGSGTCRPGHPPGEYCAVGAHCGPVSGDLTCKRDLPCISATDCDPGEYCDPVLNTCQYS